MATLMGRHHILKVATVYYRDESREPDMYKNVLDISHDQDIAWFIYFKGGGGVALAFCEVLKIEHAVQGGKQEIETDDE